MRILIIEDDLQLSEILMQALYQESYVVDNTYTGEEGEDLAAAYSYDLILLNIMLPGKDGFEVCMSLRQNKIKTPILVMTAKTGDNDMIMGIDSGADDYLGKPFSIDVLYSKIRALIRRSNKLPNPNLKIRNLSLDTVNHRVWRDSQEINLTSREYAVLEFLAYRKDSLITRSTLEQHVWADETSSNNMDVHIKNMRNKLGEENRDLILTIRGQGYRLVG